MPIHERSDAALAAALEEMIRAARAAWPGVSLDPDEFARHALERAGGSAETLQRLHAADLWLALAGARGDKAALATIDEVYLQPMRSQLPLHGLAWDDLAQALRERLLVGGEGRPPRIADYSGQGALGAWLRVAAIRLAVNLRRAEKEHRPTGAEMNGLHAQDPEAALLKRRYGPAFDQAVRTGFAALEPRERTLLRQHFIEGLSIDRLAPLYGVHRATAARRLAATRGRLLEEILRGLQAAHALTPSEARSLLRLVKSQLEFSLRTLVRR